jgi:3',5'-cyclic AMP phosphodiesterase CpdA
LSDDDDRGGAKEYCMSEFRLIQISDTHLARRLPTLTGNFDRVREYIDARRPDLVVDSGDLAFDGPTNRDDLEFAKALHYGIPAPCRYLPGNHDIGDNPTEVGPAPSQPATERDRQVFVSIFGEDRWRFDAAGWCFIGLNSLIMNTGLASEAEQFDWLASQLANANGRPVALFPAQAAIPEFAGRPRTRGYIHPLHPDAGAKSPCRNAARRRSAAGRQRPRASAQGFHLWSHPPHLGAFGGLHHS